MQAKKEKVIRLKIKEIPAVQVKSLGGAPMKFVWDDGWAIDANIRYDHHTIRVRYFRWLPEYEGWEPVQIEDQISIFEWWHIHIYKLDIKAIRDELQELFETVIARAEATN